MTTHEMQSSKHKQRLSTRCPLIRLPTASILLLILVPTLGTTATLHVPGEYATIQAAIDAAVHGDSVLVAPGVYTEACQETPHGVSMLVMKSGVTLLSEAGPELTILDAQHECRVISCEYVDEETRIEGFSIENGTATGQELYEDHGGGVFCFHSSPVIAQCVFSGSVALIGGGFACDHPSLPELLHCDFVENSALGGSGGGVAFLGSSAISVTGCTFSGNQADVGGGMECSVATPTVTDCAFLENSATIRGGAIHGHIATPIFLRCTFALNSATHGGTVYCESSSFVTITECTFFGGIATEDGSATVVCGGGSAAILGNTIVAFSIGSSALFCEDGSSSATLDCCDVYGNEGGDWVGCIADQLGTNGNISEDPLFCDAESGDFTLAADSPCAPDNNLACGLVGAWPVGCDVPSLIETATWGRIKVRYR